MRFVGIIPARYASTRFPGKPLVEIEGMTMIERVYKQVNPVLDKVCVATDDERIYKKVEEFGGEVIITSPFHQSGTDRCYEAYEKLNEKYDVIINIQGDEPFIGKSQITILKDCFIDSKTQIATLVKSFSENDSWENLANPNTPKVIINNQNQAIYFSRSVIPYLRNIDKEKWVKHNEYYKHIGIYAYKAEVLSEIIKLPQSVLEKAESLEQLRWIEAGYSVKVGFTDEETIGIDTPEDLHKAIEYIKFKTKK